MAYREVSVIEVREVLRAWLTGAGLRTVAAQAGVDRKTVPIGTSERSQVSHSDDAQRAFGGMRWCESPLDHGVIDSVEHLAGVL
jgi:hypothetical protein